jgi:hypothetical protein
MAVGLERPVATRVSVKPAGSVAAEAEAAMVVRSRTERRRTKERTPAIEGRRERMGNLVERSRNAACRRREAQARTSWISVCERS